MRFRDLVRDINRHEQKLENVLLYVDFMDHDLPVILLKDGSLLVLFQLAGLDYEGPSENEKEQFSHYARVALEQLPDEGAGFMLSNLLIRDTPQPLPLRKNPEAHPLIQFLQGRKQDFWDDLVTRSFGNRILCGLRYFHPKRTEPPWESLTRENKLFRFYRDQLKTSVQKLEQGFVALASGLRRFGFPPLDRARPFQALYAPATFVKPPACRPAPSPTAPLSPSTHSSPPREKSILVNR